MKNKERKQQKKPTKYEMKTYGRQIKSVQQIRETGDVEKIISAFGYSICSFRSILLRVCVSVCSDRLIITQLFNEILMNFCFVCTIFVWDGIFFSASEHSGLACVAYICVCALVRDVMEMPWPREKLSTENCQCNICPISHISTKKKKKSLYKCVYLCFKCVYYTSFHLLRHPNLLYWRC